MTKRKTATERALVDGRLAIERSRSEATALNHARAAIDAGVDAGDLLASVFRAGHSSGANWMRRELDS